MIRLSANTYLEMQDKTMYNSNIKILHEGEQKMKRIIITFILSACLLFSACSGISALQEENNFFDNEQVFSNNEQTFSEEEQESESVEEGRFISSVEVLDYIPYNERYETKYKPYYNLLHHGELEDGSRIQVYEEYYTNQFDIRERYVVLQYTNTNGTPGAIRFLHDEWELRTLAINNNVVFAYTKEDRELSADNTEIFIFSVQDIPEDGSTLRDMINDNTIAEHASGCAFSIDFIYPSSKIDEKYILEEGENYDKLIYNTSYGLEYSRSGGASYQVQCHGSSCVYDDYENNKRIMMFYGGKNNENYYRGFLEEIEFIEEEFLFTQNRSGWVFPEGMTGGTDKTPMFNGMSLNQTLYLTPDNHEMLFHWYGPETLGTQALEANGILTLQEGEGLYKLNAQAIPINEIVDMYDVESYGLLENQHFMDDYCKSILVLGVMEDGVYSHVAEEQLILHNYDELKAQGFENGEDCFVFDRETLIDDYDGTHIIYPIVDDDGYKGYATLLYGSDYNMPQDYVYFFTYVEREDIYDNERALEVISSIDYHLGIE